MIIIIFKTIIAYFILLFVGTNLLGIFVRGLLVSGKMDSIENPELQKMFKRDVRANHFVTLSGLVLAAAMLMFSGIPDLIFEIRTGEKINLKNISKKPIDYATTLNLLASFSRYLVFFYILKITNTLTTVHNTGFASIESNMHVRHFFVNLNIRASIEV